MSLSLKSNADGSAVLQVNGANRLTIAADGDLTDANGRKLATSAELFSVGQTPQDVTASRAFDVTYTNTTGRPISLHIRASLGSAVALTASINGGASFFIGQDVAPSGTAYVVGSVVIPPGATYLIGATSSADLRNWTEVR